MLQVHPLILYILSSNPKDSGGRMNEREMIDTLSV
jgi:hypothetical protein